MKSVRIFRVLHIQFRNSIRKPGLFTKAPSPVKPYPLLRIFTYPGFNNTWHGFEKRQIKGVSRLMEINYVRDWRDREQLVSPDQAITTGRSNQFAATG